MSNCLPGMWKDNLDQASLTSMFYSVAQKTLSKDIKLQVNGGILFDALTVSLSGLDLRPIVLDLFDQERRKRYIAETSRGVSALLQRPTEEVQRNIRSRPGA